MKRKNLSGSGLCLLCIPWFLTPALLSAQSAGSGVINPGFEQGELGWAWSREDRKAGFTQISNEATHNGRQGLRIAKDIDSEKGSSVVSSRIAIVPGKTYTLSYWVRTISSGAAAVYVRFYDAKNESASVTDGKELLQPIPAKLGKWEKNTITFIAPANVTQMEIWIHAATKGQVHFDVDDFLLAAN